MSAAVISRRLVYRVGTAVSRILVSVGLIWWCFRQIDLEQLADGVGRLRVGAVAAAVGVLLAQLMLTAWRWRLVCAALRQEVPSSRNALRWSGLSLMLSQVLPSTVGGDFYRIGAFSRQAGILLAARSVVHDRLMGLLSLATLAALASAAAVWLVGPSMAFGAMLIFSSGIVLILTAGSVVGRGILRYIPLAVARRVGCELEAFGRVGHSPQIFLISIAVQVLTLAAVLLIHFGSGLRDAQTWQFIVVTPGAMLASAMPISLGGWGVREGYMAYAFQALGAGPQTPIFVSLGYGITLLISGLFGMLAWAVLRASGHEVP